MTRAAKIRTLLLEAPSTAYELAAILGVPSRRLSSQLARFLRVGVARADKIIPRGVHPRSPPINLYELTVKGIAKAHADPIATRRKNYQARVRRRSLA